jgi:GT2 family glycosyltransferase
VFSLPAALWGAVRRVRVVTARLTDRPFVSRESAGMPVEEAVRWMGPLDIGGRVRDALFCHPAASVTFRLDTPAGARLRVHCGIVPEAWRRNAGVRFEISAERVKSGRSAGASRTLRTARRLDHRRWRRLRLAVPPPVDHADDLVNVRLSTSTPPGSHTGQAWAVFGDPVVEWRQPVRRLLLAVRSFASRVKNDGVAQTLQYAKDAGVVSDQQAAFEKWIRVNTPGPEQLEAFARQQEAFPLRPTISIITPVYNTDPQWLRACIDSVRRQVYPNWELCLGDDGSTSAATVETLRTYADDPRIRIARLDPNGGISAASNAALAMATGELIALLDHDDELPPEALFEVVRRLNEGRDQPVLNRVEPWPVLNRVEPWPDVLYSDEDKLEPDGRRSEPYFKPDWSPELLLAYMYPCHLFVARRSLVMDVGGFRTVCDGAQDYDLLLRLAERTTRIEHIDRILYHWRKIPQSVASVTTVKPWALEAGRRALEDAMARRGWEAEVLPGAGPGIYRVKRRVRGMPLVSIVIPTRGGTADGGPDLVARCLESLRLTHYAHVEVIVAADDGAVSEAVRDALAPLRHTIVPYRAPDPGVFNFSHTVNAGVAAASGEHLVLLNDDVEVTEGGWLEAMLEFSQDAEVGAVGARLEYPDGRLQHVGLLLGVRGIAAHAFHQRAGRTPGYFGSNVVTRNASAVTAACLMTRKALFDETGGFDDALPVDFNDVDYCLRLRRAGYRIVYTPYASLIHHESASVGARIPDPERAAEMRRRWSDVLDRDPYYSRHLSREHPDYRISSGT